MGSAAPRCGQRQASAFSAKDTDAQTDADTQANAHAKADSYAQTNSYAQTHGNAEAHPHSEAKAKGLSALWLAVASAVHKLRSAFLPWSIAAAGAIIGGGCDRISSHRVEAIVTDTKEARREGGKTLLAGETIAGGTNVQTGSDGRADLMLMPNMLLRLEEDGELQVSDLKFSADGNETAGGVRERSAVLRLSGGRLISRLEQHGYNTTSLAIQTSRAEVRADADALFEIAQQPQATSVTCVRGLLGVAPASAGRAKTVWPGETMLVDDAGLHRITLAAADRTKVEARCGPVEAALQLEAAAQMEARR